MSISYRIRRTPRNGYRVERNAGRGQIEVLGHFPTSDRAADVLEKLRAQLKVSRKTAWQL